MCTEDEPRIWAKRDRTIVTQQRRLARAMRAAPTEAERKLGGICATVFLRLARIFAVKFELTVTSSTLPVTRRALSSRSMAASNGAASAADEAHTKVLEANGYRVLRYWNNDVLTNINGVLEDILNTITTTPTPNPSPQGQGYRI